MEEMLLMRRKKVKVITVEEIVKAKKLQDERLKTKLLLEKLALHNFFLFHQTSSYFLPVSIALRNLNLQSSAFIIHQQITQRIKGQFCVGNNNSSND